MATLQFQQPIQEMRGFINADAVLGDWPIEVIRKVRDMCSLRDASQQIAHVAVTAPKKFGILILDEPSVTADLVRDEWQYFTRILDHGLKERLGVVGTIAGFGIASFLKHDAALLVIWRELQPLLSPPPAPPKRQIGFHQK